MKGPEPNSTRAEYAFDCSHAKPNRFATRAPPVPTSLKRAAIVIAILAI